ncbi:lipid II:glycine glycyltransferase FemX [Arthrobacter sp. H14-L1]|uniref:lipid II:glycine glycyltransferase FemX n=1 Tax=Arthrobacter sp. H14-L1 TaxID=2996697 RepID=UPI00226DE975|nr:peptidoglycan bridge formation glycyltransferase FemA/FemB family protein [Arthrobacter sp. H14-L1]MCY0905094.1 peptidoglycan bridge formation glycyltransferase FemA/FemB family protein [Arthrobacter sp. H14-L1]
MTAENYRYEELTPERFAEIAAAYPDVSIPLEQTPQWADFERDTGRAPFGIFAYFDDAAGAGTAAAGGSVAGAVVDGTAAPVVVASFLHSTRRLRESMVVVNGPVWFGTRTAGAERRLLSTLRAQFDSAAGVNPVFVRLQVEHPQRGVVKALEPGWYDREIVVDLNQPEKTMLAGFRPNARQSIRKATRAGVQIRTIAAADRLAVFRRELFPIMTETAARDGFSSFDSGYYETLLTSLADHTELMVADLDGQALCWLITTEYRGYAVYYFAASSAQARTVYAPYLLLWESFRMLKAHGNTACGLTGIVSDTYPSLANVTTFKRNFSKDVVVLPTTYDVPMKQLHYGALGAALKLRREGLPAGRRGLGRVRARAKALLRRWPAEAGSTGSFASNADSGARHD